MDAQEVEALPQEVQDLPIPKPEPKPRVPHTEPSKDKLQGALQYAEYLAQNNYNHNKQRLFDFFNISRRSGHRILAQKRAEDSEDEVANAKRRKSLKSGPETRGRKTKFRRADIQRIEDIIKAGGINTWQQLTVQAGLATDVQAHKRTLRSLIQSLEYHKCIACPRNWLAPHVREERKNFAWQHIHWKLGDWSRVRWTDVIHFVLSPPPQRTLRILRRHGERYCSECFPGDREPARQNPEKDEVHLHAWAMVGWNYKSRLIWYTTTKTNNDGKMSQQTYIDTVYEPVVKPLLQAGEDFIVEEDRDAVYGIEGNKNNPLRQWRDANRLGAYMNPAKSPDLTVIEDCLQSLRQKLTNMGIGSWDKDMLMTRANSFWDNELSYSFINRQIGSMEARIHEVVETDGQLVGH